MPAEPAVAAAVVLYLLLVWLPGGAGLVLLGVAPRDVGVALGMASGLGLVVWPLLFLWAATVGVSLGPGVVWGVLGLATVVVGWGVVSGRALPRLGRWRDWLPLAVLGAVVLIVLAARWFAARELVVPPFGDSVHHTMIVRLFARGGGLVDSWQPLAPLASFSYHFGLHAGVTALHWVTGLPEHQALLVAGQVLQVLGVLTAYGLVAGLTGRRWAGVGAALAAGGLSTMPAYYLNWGRYTQLAGQVVLPVAGLAAVWAAGGRYAAWGRVADGERRGIATALRLHSISVTAGKGVVDAGDAAGLRCGLLAVTLVAGLALTHYLVTLVFALFVLSWWLVGMDGPWRGRVRAAGRLGLVAVGALGLALPWVPRFVAGEIDAGAVAVATGELPGGGGVWGVVDPSYVLGQLGTWVGWPLVGALVAGVMVGFVWRVRVVAVGVVWIGLLGLAAYPGLVGWPGYPLLKDFTVAIGLYVPAGLVVGGALSALVERMGVDRGGPRAWGLAVVVLAVAVVAALGDRDPVRAENVYVRPADLRAMAWIREEVPADAVFLVSGGLAYGDTVAAGDDAGWWIPLLAERRSTLPPITYGHERPAEPDLHERVRALTRAWHEDIDGPAARAALDAAGVTHAYVGARAGALEAERLAASADWERVYGRDGAAVFRRRVVEGAP